ncbi:hypothetical protein HO133_002812 [Letharia lupina]|uniref:Glutaredoxin-like protein n=1 Tax=Letharia lupina TaxID=560253 RepID=A0A8H6CD91_9LECA|nr:uncharacterized protein HO133_002812 [Letharia lupina]KAF6221131.1 hypothetical protein HO133_002812 [Letharia lupina]
MPPSVRLLQHTVRVTLFTRENCSICEKGKKVIQEISKRRTFDYRQVDVMASDQQQWKPLYEFDTPVLHVQRVFHTYSKPDIATEACKLMHYFDERQVEELINEAEGHS